MSMTEKEFLHNLNKEELLYTIKHGKTPAQTVLELIHDHYNITAGTKKSYERIYHHIIKWFNYNTHDINEAVDILRSYGINSYERFLKYKDGKKWLTKQASKLYYYYD